MSRTHEEPFFTSLRAHAQVLILADMKEPHSEHGSWSTAGEGSYAPHVGRALIGNKEAAELCAVGCGDLATVLYVHNYDRELQMVLLAAEVAWLQLAVVLEHLGDAFSKPSESANSGDEITRIRQAFHALSAASRPLMLAPQHEANVIEFYRLKRGLGPDV